MFVAALFTIDKTWKQPKYLSTDEKRKYGVYICKVCKVILVKHKKKKKLPFATT